MWPICARSWTYPAPETLVPHQARPSRFQFVARWQECVIDTELCKNYAPGPQSKRPLANAMNSSIRSIVHPTDFSDLSTAAFAHALRIALAAKSKLHLLHVSQYDAHETLAFPHAQALLVQWGLTQEGNPP